MIKKWSCPHKSANLSLLIRGYKSDYESPALIKAKLCENCYSVYSRTSFCTEYGTVSRIGIAATALKAEGSEMGV